VAKDLPYYKHFPGEWITGDITLCSMTTQGVFVNLCNYYWNRSCCMSYANAVQRFTEYKNSVDELIKNGIIKTSDNENEKMIIIEFLDEQMQEFENISEKRRESANKRYSTNAVQEQYKSSAKPHNKEERREEKRIVKKQHSFSSSPYYDFEVFKEPLLKNGWNIEKIKNYYDRAEGYSEANGGKYLDWIKAVQNWERKSDKPKQASFMQ